MRMVGFQMGATAAAVVGETAATAPLVTSPAAAAATTAAMITAVTEHQEEEESPSTGGPRARRRDDTDDSETSEASDGRASVGLATAGIAATAGPVSIDEVVAAQVRSSETSEVGVYTTRTAERLLDAIEESRDPGGIRKTRFSQAGKRTAAGFERKAKNFIANDPDILFTCDYVLEDKLVGMLLVWEKYVDATHYEVLKKNLFQSGADFERILFLDAQNLEEERNNFVDYLKNTVGMSDLDENGIFVVLDTKLKEDRIYEYKVSAARVPSDAKEVDIDLILEEKDLLTYSDFSQSTPDLFTYAGTTLGSKDLAWALSVVNDDFKFFGRVASEESLNSVSQSADVREVGERVQPELKQIAVPRNIGDILHIVKESISLFGSKPVLNHLVSVLGGLPSSFRDMFTLSVDEARNVFSYDKFRSAVRAQVPIFEVVSNIAESVDDESKDAALQELSTLSIVIPNDEGTESFTTVAGMTNIFRFMNNIFLTVLYSQDDETFDKIKEIAERVDQQRTPPREDSVDEAVREIEEEDAQLSDEDTEEVEEISPGAGWGHNSMGGIVVL